jgi:hypothetical protein
LNANIYNRFPCAICGQWVDRWSAYASKCIPCVEKGVKKLVDSVNETAEGKQVGWTDKPDGKGFYWRHKNGAPLEIGWLDEEGDWSGCNQSRVYPVKELSGSMWQRIEEPLAPLPARRDVKLTARVYKNPHGDSWVTEILVQIRGNVPNKTDWADSITKTAAILFAREYGVEPTVEEPSGQR